MTTHRIRIDRLALKGDGIGHIPSGQGEGKVAFVAYTLPGEEVVAHRVAPHRSYDRWIPQSVPSPASDRRDPPCPLHFRPGRKAPWCGGCDWQHMDPAAQRRWKRELLAETVIRMGGVENPPITETLASPRSERYRNKALVPFAWQAGQVVAGFFAPGSHQIVPFDDCVVQPEGSVRVIRAVQDLARRMRWPIYDRRSGRGWLRHVLVRTNERGEALAAVVTTEASFLGRAEFVQHLRAACPSLVGIHQNVQPRRSNVVIGERWVRIWGALGLTEDVLGLTLGYTAPSFFQVNTPAAALLYEEALRGLAPPPSGTVVDLFCGVGAMTLLAARRARFAFGVESAPSAVEDARQNAAANGVSNVRFTVADAGAWINDFQKRGGAGDGGLFVVVDPPRSGCERTLLDGILALKPERVVYVSCDPATLARDIRILSAAFRLTRLTPVDLFPHTSHIEAVATLEARR